MLRWDSTLIMDTDIFKHCVSELCWIATRDGAFSRGYIYTPYVKSDELSKQEFVKKEEPKRVKFKNDVKCYLEAKVFKVYSSFAYDGLDNTEDIKTINVFKNLLLIRNLISLANIKHPHILKNNELSWGNAQKIVNLYLKNMWITGALKQTPPLFPIDSLILEELGLDSEITWTKMDWMDFKRTVRKAVEMSNSKLLAIWESEVWLKKAT